MLHLTLADCMHAPGRGGGGGGGEGNVGEIEKNGRGNLVRSK